MIDELVRLAPDLEIDHVNFNGDTPIITAVKEGSLDAVVKLIEHEANYKVVDEDGRTLGHISLMNSQEAVAEYLIDHDLISPLAKDKEGVTVFHLAAENGSQSLLEKLLGKVKSDLPEILKNNQLLDKLNRSPLHVSILSKNFNISKRFLEAGFNPNAEMKYVAKVKNAQKFDSSVAESVLAHKNLLKAAKTPIHLSIALQSIPLFKLLLKFGADISKKVFWGFYLSSPRSFD
ncbi:hypothetical protein GEMRC1_001848 [Eukaryota sp. GEM-RC1]